MRAVLLLHTKELKGDELVEIKIWQVPMSADKPYGVKYSIAYIKNGKRLVGYDNAEGKGDHRHYGDKTMPHKFTTIWDLLGAFKRDVKKMRGGDWDED